jgi:23S rRNA U2552 (ribose-2'-O)-methylase RlmE/FtsJ
MEQIYNISSKLKQNLIKQDLIKLNCSIDDDMEPKIEYGFDNMINEYRNKINDINIENWKKVRWYINNYDFVIKEPIVNRAFYKYWEIIHQFDLFSSYNNKEDLIFHCAEAPGGFIQGTNMFLNQNYPVKIINTIDDDGFIQINSNKIKTKKKKSIYTISLNNKSLNYTNNIPCYNKSIINQRLCITYGKDNTGDINNSENIDYIKTLMKNENGDNGTLNASRISEQGNHDGCYLITADGGFDEESDFNNKEQKHYQLILNEIYACICLQKKGGHFILKMFDIFTTTSIHMLYLLSQIYDNVYIYKPKTSRPTNSEKYIICKGFKCNVNVNEIKNISTEFKKMPNKSLKLFDNIPISFIEYIKKINNIIVKRQCYYLEKAINLSNNELFIKDYDKILNISLEKRQNLFTEWKLKYNLNF